MNPFTVILPRRVRAQPLPFVAKGGDCGACVLGGVLDWDIEDVYEKFGEDGKPTNYTWPGMRDVLYRAHMDGALDRIIVDPPIWPHGYSAQLLWGYPGWTMARDWFQYVLMAMDAGYYGLAVVDHASRGHKQPGDHFVMIVGARMRYEDLKGSAQGVLQEILISNSSTRAKKPEEWVSVDVFLETWGGFNAFLVRPSVEAQS